MRTNIIIDDKLMDKALKLGKFKSKREAVEEGLKLLIRLKQQSEIRKYRGRSKWEDDLEKMRLDR